MKRNIISLILITLTLLSVYIVFSLFLAISFKKKAEKFNLILISIDTLRADHMGAYGYKKNTTPNIDLWAKKAFVFTNVQTVIPSTLPSFSAMMTGVSPTNSGIIYNDKGPISDKYLTIAKLLKNSKYTTGAFITNPVLENELSGLDNGFDAYVVQSKLKETDKERNDTNSFIQKSFQWLNANKNKKLFYWVHLINPHSPYTPPREFVCKLYPNYCSILTSDKMNQMESRRKILEGKTGGGLKEDLSDEEIDLYKALYDGEIAYSDSLVDRILKEIKRIGLDKKSIVVFYGDHGEGFDHNYYFNHGGVLYDSNSRIPLMIYDPRTKQGYKKNMLVQNTDLYSTLLDVLGINHPDVPSSISFKNVFENNFIINMLSKKREYSYGMSYSGLTYSAYDGRYKLIYSSDPMFYDYLARELYDLRTDPNEDNNLLKKQKEITNRLSKELLSFFQFINKQSFISGNTGQTVEEEQKKQLLKSLGY